jgi:hypothetical protein
MEKDVPTLGVRFDVDKIDDSWYGNFCWKVFWRAMDVKKLSGAQLFEGDTFGTLQGQENVYCLAIQASADTLQMIRAALTASAEFQSLAASSAFFADARVTRELLLAAGRVDETGTLVPGGNNL